MMHPSQPTHDTHHMAGGYGPPGGGPPGGGYGPPPAGGFGAPPGAPPPPPGMPAYPPPMGSPGMYQAGVASADGDAKNVLALILNIKALLACGCMSGGLGLIPGIIGLVYAIQAGTAKSNGDFVTARAKVKTSLICAGINFGLGVLGFIAYFVFVSVAGHTR